MSEASVTTEPSGAGIGSEQLSTKSAGLEAVGKTLSTTFILWVTSIKLPHSSVILYVLIIFSKQSKLTTSEIKITTGGAQLSASSITTSGFGSGISDPQFTFKSAGLEPVGKIVSASVPQELQDITIQSAIKTFIVWVKTLSFEHWSLTVHSLTIT